ncbi:VirK/YbjX family protein [Selenomonas noxia]|mgnify:FL=1|jgi:hypothetical protein|uniref:VirK/YbjX family protein n=1 Tax=Selenomonas noxia TaxID=135083 RepID=UPI00287FF7C5|nr:VirK/YbjX family protein [Selenomonas noxia]
MIAEIRAVAHRAYRWENPRERHRALIFMVRGLLHRRQLRELYDFFHETEVRRALYERNPFPLEQATRAFFYAGSTVRSRIKLIKEHYAFLEERLKAPDFIELGLDRAYEIWRSAETDMEWNAYLKFEPGQRKEGLLSVMMDVDGTHLYQIMFWIDQRDGVPTLVIGAMQGPNTENAQDFVREMTKRAHRFRTKNLILYMVQAAARALGVRRILAVSNTGYYANNHVRRNRKLKTDFGAFWEEAGGFQTADKRFYEIPLVLPRKTMEEVPTRKRALYRRRFAFLDEVDAEIAQKMREVLKS